MVIYDEPLREYVSDVLADQYQLVLIEAVQTVEAFYFQVVRVDDGIGYGGYRLSGAQAHHGFPYQALTQL